MQRDSSMMVRSDARAEGMVTAQTTRVAAPWSSLRTRAVGIATDTNDASNGPTVRVRNLYDESVNEVRSVSSFRGTRVATRQSKSNVGQTYTDRLRRFGANIELAGGDA